MLIHMKKVFYYCASECRYLIRERMDIIMKMKKTTIFPLVAAILFIAGTASAFAMSAQADNNTEWWTYDEYKEWLENEKVELSDMIGETGWTKSQGEFVWTQEKVDEAIKMYEDILDEIKNGVLYSKSDEDGGYSMVINYDDIKVGTSSTELSVSIKLLDGEEVSFGPYATKKELLKEVEPFCNELVRNKRMTQAEAHEIITQYDDKSPNPHL